MVLLGSLQACQPASSPASSSERPQQTQNASPNTEQSPAQDAEQQTAETRMVKSYNLPVGHENEFAEQFKKLFSISKTTAGAELLPNKQLMVYADAMTHASVAKMLAELTPITAGTADAPISTEVWMVVGNVSPDAPPTSHPATLQLLQQPLKAIDARFGSQHYRVVDRLLIQSSSNRRHSISSDHYKVEQKIRVEGTQHKASIDISTEGNLRQQLLGTTIAFDTDAQWHVIGSSKYGTSNNEYLYFIVRFQR
jgi:hypothetical protein